MYLNQERIYTGFRRRTTMWLILAFAATTLALTPHIGLARSLADGESGQSQASADSQTAEMWINDNVEWTSWGSPQHALAEDGDTLWIGGAGSIIRYDKTAQSYTRYIPPGGLPHQHIYAVAVDANGNRWFGGDGGLSRLDAAEQWENFSPENSGIHEETVVAIAVGADGTIWAGHDLEYSSLSRLDADGTWHWFPTRTAAVVADYERILLTQNQNRLWTIAGADVWADLSVYTGSEWIEHAPAYGQSAGVEINATPSDRIIAADSQGTVYVSSNENVVSWWDGAVWTHERYHPCAPFRGFINRVAVDHNDTAWIAWYSSGTPYSNLRPGYNAIGTACTSEEWLPWTGPVADMTATAEGLWVLGPNWLRTPAGADIEFSDTPTYGQVTDLFHDTTGQLWVYSTELAPYAQSELRQVDDRGTLDLNDDIWTDPLYVSGLKTRAVAPDGDVWAVQYLDGRVGPYNFRLIRFHGGEWIEYETSGSSAPSTNTITDIFADDSGIVWFATRHGAYALDDGGTPGNFDDDVWTDYPREGQGQLKVAVDSLGRLWMGDELGVYRYTGTEWQDVVENSGQSGNCGLIPVENGVMLYVKDTNDTCDPLDIRMGIIWPDDARETWQLRQFMDQYPMLARGAMRRTPYWSIADDGSIWYQLDYSPDGVGAFPQIRQFHDPDSTIYELPFGAIDTLSVDSNGQMWAGDGQHLLRMTQLPDFALRVSPSPILAAADNLSSASLLIRQYGGSDNPVTLTASEMPPGMSVTFVDNPALPGTTTTLRVTVDETVAQESYEIALTGTDGTVSHSTTLGVTVVADLVQLHLPWLSSE